MGTKIRTNFIDKGLQSLTELRNVIALPPENGLLRSLRPEVKVAGAIFVIILTSLMRRADLLIFISLVLMTFAILAKFNPADFKRLFFFTFFFGFLLSIPGALNLFVQDEIVFKVLSLKRSYNFWIYYIPQDIGFTARGLERTGILTLRVFNSITTTFLLIRTTSFEEIIITLRRFRIPWTFLMIIMLSYRYILTFLKVIEDFYLAKKARFLGRHDKTIIHNWISNRIYFLFKRTMAMADELSLAMKARGTGMTVIRGQGSERESNKQTFETSYIRLEKVSYSYNGNMPALVDISLTVNKGERIAIIGANGSGKSTLLKVMAGLLYPCSGRVFFKDKEITESSLKDPIFLRDFRSSVGYVFQDPDVQLFSATVYEELIYGPLQLGLSRDEAHERAQQVMELLGIKSLQDRPPYRLSGGEKKKVAIGSVLTMNPEILLLDEPSSGLDPRTQCFLVELILYLNTEAKKTIVLTTHDLSLVEELSMKVAVLSEEHRIEKIGPHEEMLSDEALLLKVNLIHEHLHCHGGLLHRHLHSHSFFHKH